MKIRKLNQHEEVIVYNEIFKKTNYFDHVTFKQWKKQLRNNEIGVIVDSHTSSYILFKLHEFPKGRTFEVHIAVTLSKHQINLNKYVDFLEDFAKSLDCKHMFVDGRVGWKKILCDKHGFEISSTIYCKVL